MNHLLERLGSFAARKHWIVIIGWVIILGGLLWANGAFGGKYVNNYTVPGSDSSNGLNVLNADYPSQGGYGGQIVFHARHGTVAQQQTAVNQATSNVAKLSGVTKAVSPFSSPHSGAVSKNGTIAYSNVTWSDNPAGLTSSYLDKLNNAVAPARKAGLEVAYGGGAGQIGQQTSDTTSELIGLACALLLLLFMFGSFITAMVPLVSAIFSVGAGLSAVGLLASVTTFPSVAPTVATLLGLGVAVDYGLFLTARHRDQLDRGMDVVKSASSAESTSGAAIVIAGSTVVVAILGLYISGVPFVGAMGLAAAVVVAITMMAALTLVPSFMGLVKNNIRSLPARVRAHRAGISAQEQAKQTAVATEEHHEQSGFARWGRRVARQPWPWGIASVLVLLVLAIPLLSINLNQPDNGTNPTSDSSRRAYDLITDGFGVGANGPLTVVVKLPKQSGSADQSLLNKMSKSVADTHGVASVSPASLNSAKTVAVFNAIPTTRPQANATTTLVHKLRDDVLPQYKETSYVTGTTPGNVDFTEQISSRMIWLILAVVAIAFLLLTTAFRSVVIATKAVGLGRQPDRRAHHIADPGLCADDGVRDRLRPVHGLRGVPALPGARGLDLDPRRAPQCRDRHRRHRAGDHHRRRHHGDRVLELPPERPVRGEDAGPRHGGGRAHRRVAGPDDPGARDHGAARRARLVDAALAGPRAAAAAPGRQRSRGGRIRGILRGRRAPAQPARSIAPLPPARPAGATSPSSPAGDVALA